MALIQWYNAGKYFLDEAMHAMCSKGAIKVAVAADSFSFYYLEIFQLQNQIYASFPVIK